ncbi:MAG: hypothetical protein ACKOSQ_05645 [Planctomycetaceae bacterium]
MPAITLDYGAAEPLVLEPGAGAVAADCRGPAGESGAAAQRLVAEALARPAHGPPLAAHVVPGDRVVVALAGDVAQAAAVVAAVGEGLAVAGVTPAEISVLGAPSLDEGRAVAGAGTLPAGAVAFDPTLDAATAYLAADEAARPLYLARALVDADVVVAVGEWGWNAALGGRSLEGELWPTFSRLACRRDLARTLARRGRHALPDWKAAMQEVSWQLGVCASLRLVAGRGDSLHAARFGLPDEAGRRARDAARDWCPHVAAPADVAVASVADTAAGFTGVTRALAAASRVTRPGGTVCVVGRVAAGPGIIFERWRQGAPLDGLVHEAAASADPALVADALETRLFARALGDRRLVLLSDIDAEAVEDLGFGHAAGPDAVERLAHRAENLVVLHEADRMLPQLAG